MQQEQQSPWLVSIKPDESPTTLRLLCFPYAGGSASIFRSWATALPAGIELLAVQPPGRADRWREPAHTGMNELVDAMVPAVGRYVEEPFALFGHSLGALMALELAHRVRHDHGREPVHLFVGNCSAPLPDRTLPTLSTLSDAELQTELAVLGLAPEVLTEPELMDMLLPLLRADFRVADTYRYAYDEMLHCPLTAFRGAQDPMVPHDDVANWEKFSDGPFRVATLPGSHLFSDREWFRLGTSVLGELEAGRVSLEGHW